MTPDILLARIEATEAVARAATPGPWEGYDGNGAPAHVRRKWLDEEGRRCQRVVAQMHAPPTTADAAHIALNDPARVLAVCAGLREIVRLHAGSVRVKRGAPSHNIHFDEDGRTVSLVGCFSDTRLDAEESARFLAEWYEPSPPDATLAAVAAMFAEPGGEG